MIRGEVFRNERLLDMIATPELKTSQ